MSPRQDDLDFSDEPDEPSAPIRVAVACQGGGAQTAFTAGALDRLLEAEREGRRRGDGRRFEITALSGASGGALCAAFAWLDLLLGPTDGPGKGRLGRFWMQSYPDGLAAAPLEEAVLADWSAYLQTGALPWLRTTDSLRAEATAWMLELDAPGPAFPFQIALRPKPYYARQFFQHLDATPFAAAARMSLETARRAIEAGAAAAPALAGPWKAAALGALAANPFEPGAELRRECDAQEIFRGLLQRAMAADLARLAPLIDGGEARRVELLIGATDVRNAPLHAPSAEPSLANRSNFTVFRGSERLPVLIEALLASATIPELMRAVTIDGQDYWDGVFSQNPPILDLPDVHGPRLKDRPAPPNPDEIWLIQINPLSRDKTPEDLNDIEDRRNELSGNISLNQEMRAILDMNGASRAVQREGCSEERIYAPIGFPGPIEISPDLLAELRLPSKIDRRRGNTERLYKDGWAQADRFLTRWRRGPSPATGGDHPSSARRSAARPSR